MDYNTFTTTKPIPYNNHPIPPLIIDEKEDDLLVLAKNKDSKKILEELKDIKDLLINIELRMRVFESKK